MAECYYFHLRDHEIKIEYALTCGKGTDGCAVVNVLDMYIQKFNYAFEFHDWLEWQKRDLIKDNFHVQYNSSNNYVLAWRPL